MLKEHTTTNESDERLNGDGAQKIRPVKLLSRVKLLLLIDVFVGYGYQLTIARRLEYMLLDDAKSLEAIADETAKVLAGLLRALRGKS